VRVRHNGDKRVQTIKSGGLANSFKRGEWEQEIKGDFPNLRRANLTYRAARAFPLHPAALEWLAEASAQSPPGAAASFCLSASRRRRSLMLADLSDDLISSTLLSSSSKTAAITISNAPPRLPIAGPHNNPEGIDPSLSGIQRTRCPQTSGPGGVAGPPRPVCQSRLGPRGALGALATNAKNSAHTFSSALAYVNPRLQRRSVCGIC
jgi:hypothetical protein